MVSSVNSHTEKLSAYVDEFLRPLAEKIPSHVKDTTDFILRPRKLGKLPKGCYMVTLDVSSLYTNIDTDEGLGIIKEELEKISSSSPSAETLTSLLEKVLKMNNLVFDNENYLQVKGTAMGTRAAPNFAHVYMGKIERENANESPLGELIIDWARFIDDIFLLWRGCLESLMKFIEHLNNAIPSIKFTYEISQTEVYFLDVMVHKDEDGNISTDVYQKPTDTHPYLNYNSAHPPHLKKSIPYSQALRLRRICSDDQTLKERIKQYSEYFITCGYKRQTVLKEMHRVSRLTQEECLKPKTQTRLTDRVPLVTTYNPCTTHIAEIANRHWDFLKSKERLAKIFNQRP